MNQQAKRFVGHLIIADIRPNKHIESRLGITVTRRYGDAHERNRFKRITREAFRLSRTLLIIGYDINIRPRSAAKTAKSTDIQKELNSLLGSESRKPLVLKGQAYGPESLTAAGR